MIQLLTAALEAYIQYMRFKQRQYAYELEDEIDRLAADGSPFAKLRMERIAKRLQTERERNV